MKTTRNVLHLFGNDSSIVPRMIKGRLMSCCNITSWSGFCIAFPDPPMLIASFLKAL
jgi:hypothetical protein